MSENKRDIQDPLGKKRQKDLRTIDLLVKAPADSTEADKLRSCFQSMETADMLAFRISKFALKVLNQVRTFRILKLIICPLACDRWIFHFVNCLT